MIGFTSRAHFRQYRSVLSHKCAHGRLACALLTAFVFFCLKSTWPEAEVIANQCSNDELFLCFYRELRNRHMFATTNVSTRATAVRASPGSGYVMSAY